MDWLHPDHTEFWSFIMVPIGLGIILFSLKIIQDRGWLLPITMYNRGNTNERLNMNKEEIIQALDHLTREQLLELVADLTISEQEKREELDKIKGIVR